jgi:hypothetical protein
MNHNIRKILFRNSDVFRKNKIKFEKIMLGNGNMIGGGNKIIIDYDNYNYIFEESEIDDNHYILYSKNDEDCVTVIISKEDQVAEIHSIGNYKSCLMAITNEGVGSTLLKITLKMLKKYKQKLGIKMIILTDNSLIRCKKMILNYLKC